MALSNQQKKEILEQQNQKSTTTSMPASMDYYAGGKHRENLNTPVNNEIYEDRFMRDKSNNSVSSTNNTAESNANASNGASVLNQATSASNLSSIDEQMSFLWGTN